MAATRSKKRMPAAGAKAPAAGLKEAVRVKPKDERLMYVGPNIPGGRLMSGQVFRGGYPPHCRDLLEKVPEIRKLFVSVDRLMEVQRKLKEPGSNEARLYAAVKSMKEVG